MVGKSSIINHQWEMKMKFRYGSIISSHDESALIVKSHHCVSMTINGLIILIYFAVFCTSLAAVLWMCQSGSQESVHQESMDCFKILREYLGNHEFCPQIDWGGLSFPCFVSHHPILGNTINDHLIESPGASGAVAAIDHVPQNWAANGCHVNSNP